MRPRSPGDIRSTLVGRGLYSEIGRRVRAARVAQRLSPGELAAASGVGKSTIVHLELGNNRPTVRTLYLLAAHLDVEVGALLPRWDELSP